MTIEEVQDKKAGKKKEDREKTTIHLLPHVAEAIRVRAAKRIGGQKLNLQLAIEEAIKEWLAPPRVIYWDVLTAREQYLVDRVVDMMRKPRDPSESTIIDIVENFLKMRQKG